MIPAPTKDKPSDLRAEIADHIDRAQLVLDLAQSAGRDMGDDEIAEFDAELAAAEALKPRLKAAEALRDKMLEVAATQSVLNSSSTSRFPQGVRMGLSTLGTQMTSVSPASRLATGLKTFTGPTALADAQASGEFLRSVINGDIKMTMTEGSPTGGGYTVPAEFARTVIDKRERVGVSRQTATVQPMASDTLLIPKLTSGPAVSYVGEAQAIAPVDQIWGQIQLSVKKRAVLVKLSNELLADSVVNLAEYVATRAAFELAKQEDQEYINGDGTSTYGNEVGLLASLGAGGVSTAATGVDTWPEITMSDMTSAMGLLPSDYGDNTSWVCSPQFYYTVMVRLLASAGGNDIVTLEAGGGTRPTFLGRPVYLTSAMPTTSAASQVSALYGVFDQASVIGDRVALEVAISSEKYFDEYCTALRVIARYDINCHELGDADNAGAVIGLKTAA